MWCCYRFEFADDRAKADRLDDAIATFADAIVKHVGGASTWTAASAPALPGTRDVWFGLPHLPTQPELTDVWRAQLSAQGLAGQRVPNRN